MTDKGIFENTGNQQDQAAPTWEQLVVAQVDGNANKWFENFNPAPPSEYFASQLKAMGRLKELSVAARDDLKMVPGFDLDTTYIGESVKPEDTNLGQSILSALSSLGVKMASVSSSGVDYNRDFEMVPYSRISGDWATADETPFKQNFETYIDSSGNVTGLWFVNLVVSPIPMEPYNQFEITNEDSGVDKVMVSDLALSEGAFTVGELSTRVQIPHFLKNLAYMCETPLPGSQLMTLSRDLAFGDVPESLRPVPFFAHRKSSSIQAFSELATNESDTDI